MAIDYKRIDRQYTGALRWKDNGFIGLIEWATGVGKGFFLAFTDTFRKIKGFIPLYLESYPKGRIILVSSSQTIKSQNYSIIEKSIPKALNQIVFVTIDELINGTQYHKQEFDLMIADEVDVYTSHVRREYINNTLIKYKHFLGLTATPFLIKKYYNEFLNNVPIVDTISLSDATKLDFVADSIEYNLGLELPEEDYVAYKEYTNLIAKGLYKFTKLYGYLQFINSYTTHSVDNSYYKMRVILNACLKGCYMTFNGVKQFYKSYHFTTKLAELNGYNPGLNPLNPYHKEIIDDWKPENITKFCGALLNAFESRENLLKKHILKHEVTVSVLNQLNIPETIIFGESSENADVLYHYINTRLGDDTAVLYHSKAKIPIIEDGKPLLYKSGKNKDKVRYYGTTPNSKGEIPLMKYNLNKLDNGSKVLVAVKGLSRGFNRPSIELVIITSLTESSTNYYQRKGRGIRLSENGEELNVFIVNIYFKYTIEERKLKQIQQHFLSTGGKVYWINQTEGITTEPDVININ